MRGFKVRHGKKFQARRSAEDLFQIYTNTFKVCGIENIIQARIIRDVQRSLSANPNPKITLLQGKPRVQTSRAWIWAATYVTRFLQRFPMPETLATITDENKGRELETDESADFGGNILKYLIDAIERARRRPKLATRVARFEREWSAQRPKMNQQALEEEEEEEDGFV
jgi:hypothetical protein